MKWGNREENRASILRAVCLLALAPRVFLLRAPEGQCLAAGFERSMQAPSRLAKVKVMKSGDIFCNGRRVSLEELDQELRRLKNEGGGVEYDREGREKEPEGDQAKAVKVVLDKIVQYRLPVKFAPPPSAKKK